jgi:hypothetical protein|tara:strand:+ start:5520 stop:5864 length:345 start_codon:yes stop_codon:yes gene_type:complete
MYELITINGKEHPIRFGMNALRIFCKETDRSLNDLGTLGKNMTLDDSCQLIKAGLSDGYRKAGKEFNISVEDISDFLDDDMDLLTRAMNIFSEQFNTEDKGNDKGNTLPKKKKS